MQAPPNPMLNLPPDVAAALQEQVSKMSPAQVAAMMESVKGVDMAAAAAQAQAALAGASAEDVRRMGAAMASAPPEAVRANVAAANARTAAEVAAAGKLKADGNAAFARGDTAAAAASWGRAADSLAAHSSSEAVSLRRACQLNLALAHLKTGDWAAAEAAAGAVLAAEPANAKALLRRGSARLGAGKGRRAVTDLEAALAAAAPGDKEVVREKLEEARALVAGQAGDGDGEVEEVEEEEEVVAAAPPPSPPPPSMPFPGFGAAALPTGAAAATQAAQLRSFAAALRANPGLKDTVAAQAASMSPAQVAAAARAAGAAAPPPEALTPAGMAAAAQAASAMTPEQLEAMADALEKSAGGSGGGSGSSPASAPPPPPPTTDMAALMRDPAMVKQAAEMIKTMDPRTLAALSGGAVSEEAAAAMQAKLGGLSEAQLAGLVSAAQKVQAAKARVDAARAWLAGRPGVVAALAVLVVALLLRRWGWV
jgi:trimeric autotransporter adhesin